MKVVIFLCSNETMRECFKKNLFGTNETYGEKVRKGDILFLYNYSSKNLYGFWIAITNSGIYDPKAWGGKYLNQVRISQYTKDIVSFPIYSFYKILGKNPKVGKILKGYDAQKLIKYFDPGWENKHEHVITLADVENDYRNKHPVNFMCEDGHRVRSTHEKIIDDWLYKHKVPHAYEPILTQPDLLIPDFEVYSQNGESVYIEYWGMLNDPSYGKRRLQKLQVYKKHKLTLIEIMPKDLHSIATILPRELKRFNVPFK